MKRLIWIVLFLTVPLRGAELLLKIGNDSSSGFNDGNIIHAFNDKYILNIHAQHFAHVKLASVTENNLRYPGKILDKYLSTVMEHKFVRISKKTIRRINIKTGVEEIISGVANAKGEHMDVPLYIRRRLKSPRHKIFGTPGSEYWYGGSTNITNSKMNKVWNRIEASGNYNRSDYGKFPFTDKELSKYYSMPVIDFTDAERSTYEEPEMSGTGENAVIVKQRKHVINYRALNGLTAQDISDIQNSGVKIDHRGIKQFPKPNVSLMAQ